MNRSSMMKLASLAAAVVSLALMPSCADRPSPAEARTDREDVEVVQMEAIDSASDAAAYLRQTLPLYVSDLTTGTIEVRKLSSATEAAEIVGEMWGGRDAWSKGGSPGAVYVAVFRAHEGAFITPRPRPGFSEKVAGDTFVLIVNPSGGIESKATTTWERAKEPLDPSQVLYERVETVSPAP
jgi:hypothetical protein